MKFSHENGSVLFILSAGFELAERKTEIMDRVEQLLVQGGPYAPQFQTVHDFLLKSVAPNDGGGEKFLSMLWLGVAGDVTGLSLIRHYDGHADLDYVVVEKSLRLRGMGTAFMLEMMKELKTLGMKRLLLEVGVENVGALALYSKLGFREIARRKGYYRHGEDAIVMEFVF
jgi:ribosomal protein S18 acetylase RimI-like enzyme